MRVPNKHSVSLQRNFRISEHSGIMYRAWPANIGISENKLVITCCLPKGQKCSIIYHKGLLSSNIPKGCVNSKKVCFGWKTNFCQESGNLENFLGDMKSQSENFGKLKFFFLNVYQIFVMIFQKKTFIYTGSHYTCPYTSLFTVISYYTSCSIEDFCTDMYICSCILLSSNKKFGLCMVKNLLQTVFW